MPNVSESHPVIGAHLFASMRQPLRDPLLLVTRIILLLSMGTAALVGIICAGTSLVVWLARRQVAAAMAKVSSQSATLFPPWMISLQLLVVLALAVIVFLFLGQLQGIVGGVASGSPFVPENARRLARMGWLAVVGNLLAIKVGGLDTWAVALMQIRPGSIAPAPLGHWFSPDGWLLVLVLFVLARVFRLGTTMNSDLEGTV